MHSFFSHLFFFFFSLVCVSDSWQRWDDVHALNCKCGEARRACFRDEITKTLKWRGFPRSDISSNKRYLSFLSFFYDASVIITNCSLTAIPLLARWQRDLPNEKCGSGRVVAQAPARSKKMSECYSSRTSQGWHVYSQLLYRITLEVRHHESTNHRNQRSSFLILSHFIYLFI